MSISWYICHMTVTSGNMAAVRDSAESSVRKRHVDNNKTEEKKGDISDGRGEKDRKDGEKKDKRVQSLHTGTYWLTRIVLLRFVAFIYCK